MSTEEPEQITEAPPERPVEDLPDGDPLHDEEVPEDNDGTDDESDEDTEQDDPQPQEPSA